MPVVGKVTLATMFVLDVSGIQNIMMSYRMFVCLRVCPLPEKNIIRNSEINISGLFLPRTSAYESIFDVVSFCRIGETVHWKGIPNHSHPFV